MIFCLPSWTINGVSPPDLHITKSPTPMEAYIYYYMYVWLTFSGFNEKFVAKGTDAKH